MSSKLVLEQSSHAHDSRIENSSCSFRNRLVATPLPMQYLGGKGRIAQWIISEIKRFFPSSNKILDLFTGTGTVALNAMAQNFDVLANDIEPYSFGVLKALLRPRPHDLLYAVEALENLKDQEILLKGGRKFMKDYLHKEKKLFQKSLANSFQWKEYRDFCLKTPIIEGSVKEIKKLKSLNEWNLFTTYYSNTYFGVRQCMQIDAIRELTEDLPQCKDSILAATISAMTYGVSSTTHLAQYLRPDSFRNTMHLIKRRQFDFVDQVQQRLRALNNFYLSSESSDIRMSDFRGILKDVNLDKQWIIYADPPYFKEHYSRYYHVLNTFYLYDFPFLTYNPRLEATTEGRYREGRNVSDFGKKALVYDAFYDLFSACKDNDCKLALSYAETSLVKKDVLISLAEQLSLDVKVRETELIHSSQGQAGRTRKVKEYLFLIQKRK